MEQQQQEMECEGSIKKTIVIAVDGSDYSIYAVDFYCKHLRKEGDKCVFVYIPQLYSQKDASRETMESLMKTMKDDADHIRDKYGKLIEERSINGVVQIAYGKVAEQIINVAKDHNASCIITGSRGRGKWSRWFLGSVSTSVYRHADRPVCVVHLPDDEQK